MLTLILIIAGVVIQVVCNSNKNKWLGIIPPIYFFGVSIFAMNFWEPVIEEVIRGMQSEFIRDGFTNSEINLISKIIKSVYFGILNIPTLLSTIASITSWIVYRVKNKKNKMNNKNTSIQEDNENMN